MNLEQKEQLRKLLIDIADEANTDKALYESGYDWLEKHVTKIKKYINGLDSITKNNNTTDTKQLDINEFERDLMDLVCIANRTKPGQVTHKIEDLKDKYKSLQIVSSTTNVTEKTNTNLEDLKEALKIKYTGDEIAGIRIAVDQEHPEDSISFHQSRELNAYNNGIEVAFRGLTPHLATEEYDEKVLEKFLIWNYYNGEESYYRASGFPETVKEFLASQRGERK